MVQEEGLLYLDSRSNGGRISPVKLHDHVLCNVGKVSDIKRGIEVAIWTVVC